MLVTLPVARFRLGHQLAGALQRDGVAVVVIALDDLLLVLGILGHAVFPDGLRSGAYCEPSLARALSLDKRQSLAEQRLGRLRKIALIEQAFDHVKASFDQHGQRLFGSGRDKIVDALLGPLGS